MVTAPDTEGRRIYAIGDIHGQLEKLEAVQDAIRADLDRRPHPAPVTVYVGDFIDRGPDSRGVIENLAKEKTGPDDVRFLLGNHDRYLLGYLDEPDAIMSVSDLHWFSPRLGGQETLRSYGVAHADEGDPAGSHAAFRAAVPAMHVAFIETLDLWQRIGSYLFVHAGIRPGVPLEAQSEDDLIWIRGEFLNSTADHGMIVVHGHTISDEITNRGNRIGIDTGAAFGGTLSCLVLEGSEQSQLVGDELHPVPISFEDF